MHMNTGIHVPQHVCGDQRTTTCPCFLLCWRHGLFSVPWSLNQATWLVNFRVVFWFFSFHLAIVALGLQMGVTVMTSVWVLAILTQVLTLVWQDLCLLSVFPAPKHHFKGICPSVAQASGLVCDYSTHSSLVPWGCWDCPTVSQHAVIYLTGVRSILLYFACLSISVELRTLWNCCTPQLKSSSKDVSYPESPWWRANEKHWPTHHALSLSLYFFI